jgi:hypothetical protein
MDLAMDRPKVNARPGFAGIRQEPIQHVVEIDDSNQHLAVNRT